MTGRTDQIARIVALRSLRHRMAEAELRAAAAQRETARKSFVRSQNNAQYVKTETDMRQKRALKSVFGPTYSEFQFAGLTTTLQSARREQDRAIRTLARRTEALHWAQTAYLEKLTKKARRRLALEVVESIHARLRATERQTHDLREEEILAEMFQGSHSASGRGRYAG